MCWTSQPVSSPALVSTTMFWHICCMMNCTGCSGGSAVQACSFGVPVSAEQCTEIPGRLLHSGLWHHQSTALTFRQSTLPDCTWLYRSTSEIHLAIGSFLLVVWWPGIRCQMICVTYRVVAVVLDVLWRQHFLLGISAVSAIEMLHVCCANMAAVFMMW